MVGNHGRTGLVCSEERQGKRSVFYWLYITSAINHGRSLWRRIAYIYLEQGLAQVVEESHRVYQTRMLNLLCELPGLYVEESSGEGIVPVCVVWLLREGILSFGREGLTDDKLAICVFQITCKQLSTQKWRWAISRKTFITLLSLIFQLSPPSSKGNFCHIPVSWTWHHSWPVLFPLHKCNCKTCTDGDGDTHFRRL